MCHVVFYLGKRKYTYLYHDNDFNHISLLCCKSISTYSLSLWETNCTECLCCCWCFCLILPSPLNFKFCESKKKKKKITDRQSCNMFRRICILFCETHQLWHSHRQTAFTVRTLSVTLTTIFGLYIIVNACLKQSGFPPLPYRSLWWTFLLRHGGCQDVLLELFLFCLLWTVLSALNVYKCSF